MNYPVPGQFHSLPLGTLVRRIAILRALHLGDLVLATPALRAIRRGFPGAEITLIGLPWARDFARRIERYVDRFVEFGGYPGIAEVEVDPVRSRRFIDEQRAYGYDLVVQMHGSGRTSNPAALALGSSMTVGYYEDVPASGLTLGAPYPEAGPEVLRNLHLAELLGCPADDAALDFPLLPEDRTEADTLLSYLEGMPRPWIGIHPGSRSPARCWPVDRFAAVVRELTQRLHAQVIVTGAASELPVARGVAERSGLVPLVAAGETSLGGLAALIDRLDLFISNDTGPAHLADARGVPSVVIFGPTDPDRWAPLDRDLHRVVRRSVGCNPCPHWQCPIDHRCLRWIEPKAVVAEAVALVQRSTFNVQRSTSPATCVPTEPNGHNAHSAERRTQNASLRTQNSERTTREAGLSCA